MQTLKLKNEIQHLKAGDKFLFSGILYTARDQAHKRLVQAIKHRKKLPFDLRGAVIYYCGPAKAPKGRIIGSCGPTTSARMDDFTPDLLKAGVAAMIGKGRRSPEVIAAIKKYSAVYFLTYAGCGALLAKYVKRKNIVAYPDLGPEAILKLEVKDFPLIVGIDARGDGLYPPSQENHAHAHLGNAKRKSLRRMSLDGVYRRPVETDG